MGSSKLISTRELFYIVLLLHQGGVFWVLPYLLVKENGTASLVSLLSGLLLGAMIIAVCAFWGSRCRETTFIPSLTQLLGKPLGKIVGLLFVLFYAAFAVISLYTCIEVIGGQLLLETPRTLLICTVFLLVGWLSWNGLEDMARLTVLCVVLVAAILLLALAGSVELFSVENLLPLELRSVDDVRPGTAAQRLCLQRTDDIIYDLSGAEPDQTGGIRYAAGYGGIHRHFCGLGSAGAGGVRAVQHRFHDLVAAGTGPHDPDQLVSGTDRGAICRAVAGHCVCKQQPALVERIRKPASVIGAAKKPLAALGAGNAAGANLYADKRHSAYVCAGVAAGQRERCSAASAAGSGAGWQLALW